MLFYFHPRWFAGLNYRYSYYKQEKMRESGSEPGYSYDELDIIPET